MFRNLLDKMSWVLAWGSFILSATGGLAATGTFIGTVVVKTVQIGPWWLPFPLIGVGALLIIGDLIGRKGSPGAGIPNRMAVYLSMFWPSFFLAIPDGKLRDKMTGWIEDLNRWLDGWMAPWIGHKGSNALMTVTAVTCIAMAVVWAHRYAQDAKSTAATSTGNSPGTPIVARGTTKRR